MSIRTEFAFVIHGNDNINKFMKVMEKCEELNALIHHDSIITYEEQAVFVKGGGVKWVPEEYKEIRALEELFEGLDDETYFFIRTRDIDDFVVKSGNLEGDNFFDLCEDNGSIIFDENM